MSALLLTFALLASPPAVAPAAPKASPAPAAPAWGPKSATASAQRTEVHLGEPFTVTVEIRHDKGEVWTLKPGQKLDPFSLRSVTVAPAALPESGGGQAARDLEVTRIQLEMALFQLGPHVVPDLELVAATPKAKPPQAPHEFSLPGPEVKGIPTQGGSKQKSDIRGPVAFKVTSFRILLYLLGALVLIAAAVLGIRAWRKRPRREVTALTPAIPEDRLALEALTALESQGLPARGRFKEFHLSLSEILRRYLSDRYAILGLDMTSEELYQSLARLPSEGLSLNDLSWVCAQSDLAKFAKAAPTVDDCRQALQLVRQLVQRTRRAPVVAVPPLSEKAGRAA